MENAFYTVERPYAKSFYPNRGLIYGQKMARRFIRVITDHFTLFINNVSSSTESYEIRLNYYEVHASK